jgi:putative flippase GtrA
MKKKISVTGILQLTRFAIVGALNTTIDVGILDLLLWLYPSTNTWRTLGYNSLAILLGATNSFFWNKYWTFQQRNKITGQEVFRFVVLAVSTMLLNDGLILLLSKTFPTIMQSSLLGANVLKLAAIVGTMSISFFGMRIWVFFHKKHADDVISVMDMETLKLPALKLAYDVTIMVNGVIKPIYEIDTAVLPAISVDKHRVLQEQNIQRKSYL